MNAAPQTPSPAEAHDSPWYRKAFGAGYLDLYAHRDEADAARAVAFLRRQLRLERGVRLLDLCCGPGRHLGQLVPLLGSAVGIDLSRALLSQARDSCRANLAENFAGGDHRFHLVEGDMRHLPFAEGLFDIVINLFTSFGYFEPEEENLAVLEEIVRVLHPSGVFVLDHINRSHLETFLEADSERRLRNGARVFERRRFDPGRRRIIKHVEWVDPGGGRIRWDESVRVYDEQELAAVFLRVGFGSLIKFGDYDGSPLQSDSARMIIIARRGAAA